MTDIIHPLELNTVIISSKPPCTCKGPGAPWEETKGAIRKVINNHSGVWYFISSGSTVKAEWVKEIVK